MRMTDRDQASAAHTMVVLQPDLMTARVSSASKQHCNRHYNSHLLGRAENHAVFSIANVIEGLEATLEPFSSDARSDTIDSNERIDGLVFRRVQFVLKALHDAGVDDILEVKGSASRRARNPGSIEKGRDGP